MGARVLFDVADLPDQAPTMWNVPRRCGDDFGERASREAGWNASSSPDVKRPNSFRFKNPCEPSGCIFKLCFKVF